jgi:hypothetical protein
VIPSFVPIMPLSGWNGHKSRIVPVLLPLNPMPNPRVS